MIPRDPALTDFKQRLGLDASASFAEALRVAKERLGYRTEAQAKAASNLFALLRTDDSFVYYKTALMLKEVAAANVHNQNAVVWSVQEIAQHTLQNMTQDHGRELCTKTLTLCLNALESCCANKNYQALMEIPQATLALAEGIAFVAPTLVEDPSEFGPTLAERAIGIVEKLADGFGLNPKQINLNVPNMIEARAALDGFARRYPDLLDAKKWRCVCKGDVPKWSTEPDAGFAALVPNGADKMITTARRRHEAVLPS